MKWAVGDLLNLAVFCGDLSDMAVFRFFGAAGSDNPSRQLKKKGYGVCELWSG